MNDATSLTPVPFTFDWLRCGWRAKVVALAALLSVLLAVALVVDQVRLSGLFGTPGRGVTGFEAEHLPGHPGVERITFVRPGSPAATAGLAPGMVIRYDYPYEASANALAGTPVGVVAAADVVGLSQGKTRHVLLVRGPSQPEAGPLAHAAGELSVIFAGGFCILLALVALVRGRHSPGAVAFGIGILGFIGQSDLPTWAATPALADTLLWICAVQRASVVALLVLPMVVYAEVVGSPGRAWKAALVALTGAVLGLMGYLAWCSGHDAQYPVLGDGEAATFLSMNLSIGVGLYWGWRGRRDSLGAERQRFTALVAAFALLVALGAFDLVLFKFLAAEAGAWTFLASQLASNVLVPLTLAYVVLRHKVVDPGFVLNRTVVYGSVSALLLGSFGLIEWGVEHLLPEQWLHASLWIDAGAAVLVYLVFHRIHDTVESRIEHLFFRRWQANEDHLRRFVASAAHFDDDATLMRAFVTECARFGDGARGALYRRGAHGVDSRLERVAQKGESWPQALAGDDPAYALMRAERAPLDLTDRATELPGVIALPMLDHGALTGLVLLDWKGNGASWRPDEIALLGWAAHEVGLALGALSAGRIEQDNQLLKAEVSRLSTLIGERLRD